MLRAGVAAVNAALAVATPKKDEKSEPDASSANQMTTPPKEEAKVASCWFESFLLLCYMVCSYSVNVLDLTIFHKFRSASRRSKTVQNVAKPSGMLDCRKCQVTPRCARSFMCSPTVTMLSLLVMFDEPVVMQEILDYLSMFTDPTEQVSGDQSASARVHPADLVLEAFKDEETTYLTTQKIHTFLQEAHAVHGKKFEMAAWPASCL